MDFNPYKILNVDQGAELEFITNAYRYLSKKYHPDLNKTPEAAIKMRDINRAYDMLKDPSERRKVDEQLSREATAKAATNANPRPNYSTYTRSSTSATDNTTYTPRYPNYRPSSATSSGPFDQFREWTQKWGKTPSDNASRQPKDEPKPTPPSDKTLYLYKKSLVDDVNKKALRISVYYESARGTKVCEIFSSAPDAGGRVISGTVFFHAEELFDFVTLIEESVHAFDQTNSPIQVESDHVVYWRQTVQGISKTFLGLEIIKKNRANAKEGLLLLGEKEADGGIEGVAAPQTAKQIQQLARIMSEALIAMRN
ncbi:MAG: DnaJ domain-containing protein [Chloroflexota bacterium]|nr:DnaJ domain-containing protein [Chloroflexota bacterium]